MAGPLIRACNEADLPAVRTLLRATWHATYDAIYGPEKVREISDRWHALAALRQGLVMPRSSFLVADDNGQIAATSLAFTDNDGRCIRLSRLYVHPSSQRRGLGRALLSASIDAFPAARCIDLEVEPENLQAITFYRSEGFSITGQGDGCGGEVADYPHLLMLKTLQRNQTTR